MKMGKYERALRYALLICGVLMVLLPLYMTLITAFKTTAENTASFFALPRSFYLGNFKGVLQKGGYLRAFFNTVYITAGVIVGNLILMPALSYAISRSMQKSRIYRLIYYFILLGIFIPFEVKMMPLVKLMSWLHLLHPSGFIILCMSSSTCEAVFLYVGFLHSIPADMEEAAYIDGASTFQTYTRIVFPLLQPMMITVIIRNGLWIWNDFMLPLVTLNRSSAFWTLTLFQYNFKTEYTTDYSLSFASFCMSMIPIVAFYVVMQRHIIGGLTSGAVKS